MSKTRTYLENVAVLAIILVLVQTFFDELAVVLSWNAATRTGLLIAGFFFDLFFTVEFIIRSYDAWRLRGFRRYFWRELGWIDFAAGIPLLLFNSGPGVLALLAGGIPIGGVGGMLNVLKVVKAIRIARVLRLLRVLKVFRRIKNTESEMAQRHVALVSAASVSTFVFTLFILAVVGMFVPTPTLDVDYQQGMTTALTYIVEEDLATAAPREALRAFSETNKGLLAVEAGGVTTFSRYSQDYLDREFTSHDYTVLRSGDVSLFVDLRPINRDHAVDNLKYFAVIVAMVLVFMFLYGPHFAMTVSDPIHVMQRGMSEHSYSLEVVIPEDFQRDDIYQLAREYNRVFLPMKDREISVGEREGTGTALSMDSLDDLFD